MTSAMPFLQPKDFIGIDTTEDQTEILLATLLANSMRTIAKKDQELEDLRHSPERLRQENASFAEEIRFLRMEEEPEEEPKWLRDGAAAESAADSEAGR